MMKSILFITLLAFIIVTVNAATSTLLPHSPGVVCAQTVCPTYTQAAAKRATPTCPSTCPDNCSVIDDVCCPGIQKAVCNSGATTATASSAVTNTAVVTTATASNIASSSVASSAAPTGGSNSASSPAASTTTTSTSTANTMKYMLSTTATMIFIAIYFLQ